MSVEFRMPALSPTMEKGTLAKWLIQPGQPVRAGDLLVEIETDKAAMEVEAVDEGVLLKVLVPEGTEDIAVGTPIALIGREGEAADAPPSAVAPAPAPAPVQAEPVRVVASDVRATPLARRLAAARGIDLAAITGSGPSGRITKADLGFAAPAPVAQPASPVAPVAFDLGAQKAIPHAEEKLSGMRRTIARRLTESKQQIPHIYLTVDVRLDALLALRAELNAALAGRGVKLSVNDMMIKALALALIEVPQCNVAFAGDSLLRFARADISVAVSIPNGLITPVIADAGSKSLSAIAVEMKTLGARAREGKLQPHEYQGGTASLSNLGMFGIRQFEAVINPPQAMILAIGTGEERAIVVDGRVEVAAMLTATGSFDHRAVDGADAARFMGAFKRLVEAPATILA